MTGREQISVQHGIAAIGLSLNAFPTWPLLPLGAAGSNGIYQPVGDTSGIVFLRYGPEDTVDQYIAKLGGMFTQVSVVEDKTLTVSGRAARRVTVHLVSQPREMYRAEPQQGITHETLAAERTVLTVIGFSNRGIPILAGYRVPDETLRSYETVLEGILASVELS